MMLPIRELLRYGLPFPKGSSYTELVTKRWRDVEAGAGLFQRQIVGVFAGTVVVVDAVGPSVGGQQCQAFAEAPFQLRLQRLIMRADVRIILR